MEYKLINRTTKYPRCGETAKQFEGQDEWHDIYIVCDCCGLNKIEKK